MAGAANTVAGVFGMDAGSRDRRDQIDREKAQAQAMADEQAKKLKQQQDAIDSQKKAEQQALSAKAKRNAGYQSGASSLINLNPEGQSSLLG